MAHSPLKKKGPQGRGPLCWGGCLNSFSFNSTITAQWNETSEYVEIVFSSKDLSREQVEEIIEKYTNGAEFTIETSESDEKTGETIVIIKFTDKEKASEFVRNVNENGKQDSLIKRVGMVPNHENSFSHIFSPFVSFYLLI